MIKGRSLPSLGRYKSNLWSRCPLVTQATSRKILVPAGARSDRGSRGWLNATDMGTRRTIAMMTEVRLIDSVRPQVWEFPRRWSIRIAHLLDERLLKTLHFIQ